MINLHSTGKRMTAAVANRDLYLSALPDALAALSAANAMAVRSTFWGTLLRFPIVDGPVKFSLGRMLERSRF
jgi:hypothetical protein